MFHPLGRLVRALPEIPHDVPFALLTRLDGRAKPWAFPTIRDLARRIQRDRAASALVLAAQTVLTRAGPRRMVRIVAFEPGPMRRIGWAWLGGHGEQALRQALSALAPELTGLEAPR